MSPTYLAVLATGHLADDDHDFARLKIEVRHERAFDSFDRKPKLQIVFQLVHDVAVIVFLLVFVEIGDCPRCVGTSCGAGRVFVVVRRCRSSSCWWAIFRRNFACPAFPAAAGLPAGWDA